jgi:drug/metabolite transporter (DMT)-like permease
VLIFRLVYKLKYPKDIYLPLLTLTVGVILVCSHTVSFNLVGVTCATAASLVFVLQNICSKKILRATQLRNLDKSNVLYYSSTLSFVLMVPLWLLSDGIGILESLSALFTHHQESSVPGTSSAEHNAMENAQGFSVASLVFLYLINGTTHFGSNIFAFNVLTLVSPVTYSIASLLKRIFVIIISLVYFQDPLSIRQILGILLTFVGCYYYNDVKMHQVVGLEEESVLRRKVDDEDGFFFGTQVRGLGKKLWKKLDKSYRNNRVTKQSKWKAASGKVSGDDDLVLNSVKVIDVAKRSKLANVEPSDDPLINYERKRPHTTAQPFLAPEVVEKVSISPKSSTAANTPLVIHSNFSESFSTQRAANMLHATSHHTVGKSVVEPSYQGS